MNIFDTSAAAMPCAAAGFDELHVSVSATVYTHTINLSTPIPIQDLQNHFELQIFGGVISAATTCQTL